MKKGIVVINVPDDIDINELQIDFELLRMLNSDGDVEELWNAGEPVRPMPKRMLVLAHIQNGNIVNVQETSFANGWNACLDEIIGEQL